MATAVCLSLWAWCQESWLPHNKNTTLTKQHYPSKRAATWDWVDPCNSIMCAALYSELGVKRVLCEFKWKLHKQRKNDKMTKSQQFSWKKRRSILMCTTLETHWPKKSMNQKAFKWTAKCMADSRYSRWMISGPIGSGRCSRKGRVGLLLWAGRSPGDFTKKQHVLLWRTYSRALRVSIHRHHNALGGRCSVSDVRPYICPGVRHTSRIKHKKTEPS